MCRTATPWLLALTVGCGSGAPDPTVLPLGLWGAEHAAAVCGKMFGCCDSGEQTTLRYASEAECRQMVGEGEQSAVSQTVAQGLIVYDAKAARRCVQETMATPCSALFHDTGGQATPSCNDVVHGALPLGAACEDLDAICESGYCTGTCSTRPGCPATCDAGQFCDISTSACSPTHADGATCLNNDWCTAPSVCLITVCGPPIADGAACRDDTECANGACIVVTAQSTICGARLGDGATCFRDQDCSSGACLGISPAPMTCGAPMSDGSPCASGAQCASGQCVVRSAGAMATCGAPYCDGV